MFAAVVSHKLSTSSGMAIVNGDKDPLTVIGSKVVLALLMMEAAAGKMEDLQWPLNLGKIARKTP
jgi:hypothetical protein